jgi:hypothetical protein
MAIITRLDDSVLDPLKSRITGVKKMGAGSASPNDSTFSTSRSSEDVRPKVNLVAIDSGRFVGLLARVSAPFPTD